MALLGTRVVMPGLEHIGLAFIAKIRSSGMGGCHGEQIDTEKSSGIIQSPTIGSMESMKLRQAV